MATPAVAKLEVPAAGGRWPHPARQPGTGRRLRKLSRWLAYQYRATTRPVVTLEGVALRVGRHMSPRVERAVWSGRYEREELRLVREVLSPSDVVLEVGAGLGTCSPAYCAKQLGSARVFAYEANPDSSHSFVRRMR